MLITVNGVNDIDVHDDRSGRLSLMAHSALQPYLAGILRIASISASPLTDLTETWVRVAWLESQSLRTGTDLELAEVLDVARSIGRLRDGGTAVRAEVLYTERPTRLLVLGTCVDRDAPPSPMAGRRGSGGAPDAELHHRRTSLVVPGALARDAEA